MFKNTQHIVLNIVNLKQKETFSLQSLFLSLDIVT